MTATIRQDAASISIIAPYRTESVFWDKYDKSESTGEVLRCKGKHDNIWLGDQASIWDYWEEN